MAISRYDEFLPVDTSFSIYQPKQYTPDLEMYGKFLEKLETEKEKGESFMKSKIPKYIPQDEPVALALVEKYNNLVQSVENDYASGNIAKGRRSMRDALRQVERDMRPGGDYYGLEQRYEQYGNLLKNYDTVLKDAPGYYKDEILKRVRTGISPFRNDITGGVNAINDPGYGKWIDVGEDIMKQLDGFEANGDTMIRMNNGYIWKEKQKQVTPEEVRAAAMDIMRQPKYSQQLNIEADIMTPNLGLSDFENYVKSSLNIPSNVAEKQRMLKEQGYYRGNIDGIEGNATKKAEQAYIKDAINTAEVHPRDIAYKKITDFYANPAVRKYSFTDRDVSVDESQFSLEAMRHANRKKEIDYENKTEFATINSRVVGNSSGMPEWDLKFGQSGIEKVVTESTGNVQGFLPPGVRVPSTVTHSVMVGKKEDFLQNAISGELDKSLPGIQQIAKEYETQLKSMPYEQQYGLLKQKYEELRSHLNTTDLEFVIPSNKKAVQENEALGKVIIGNQGALGTIANNTVYTFDQKSGVYGKAQSIEDILSEYDIKPEDFTSQAAYLGKVLSANPYHPSGNMVQLTTKNGRVVTLLATPENRQVSAIKTPSYIWNSVNFNSSPQSGAAYSGIQQIDKEYPNGLIAKRKNVRESDYISSEMEQLDNQILSSKSKSEKDALWNRYNELKDRFVFLSQNPSQDVLRETQVELYDALQPNKKAFNYQDFKQIVQMIEQNAMNYGQESSK